MEVFRACAWRKVLKGSLLQKYFRDVVVPLGAAPVRPAFHGLPAMPLFPAVGTRTAVFSQDRMDFADLEFRNPECIETLTGFSLSAELTASRRKLPGNRVDLCAYRFKAGVQGDEVPVLTLEDQAFEDHELVFADMEGALFVTPPRGERRETVLDGLRFATGTETTAAGGRRVVVIDRSRTPSPEMLRAIGGALECSLDVAESLLFAPLARSPDAIRFARGYLEWLAEIWNGDERRRDLRIRALYLARAAGCFPRERAFPRECSGVLGEDRSAILDAATRLQGLWSHIVMWFRERRLRISRRRPPRTPGRLCG